MANFAVNADEKVIQHGNQLIDRLKEPGQNKADALKKIFELAESQIDDEIMKENGLDVEALDAALKNLRSIFLGAVSGREELKIRNEKRIDFYREQAHKMEQKAAACQEEAESAVKKMNELQSAHQKILAGKDDEKAMLEAQIQSQKDLLDEMKKTNDNLAQQIEEAKHQNEELSMRAEHYDQLKTDLIQLKHDNEVLEARVQGLSKLEQRADRAEKELKEVRNNLLNYKQLLSAQDYKMNASVAEAAAKAKDQGIKEAEDKAQNTISKLQEDVITLREERARLLYKIELLEKEKAKEEED